MAEGTVSKPRIEVKHRGILTAGLMLATVMQVLDTTIANVALPHMSASLNAAQSEINWVLTSYIVASAIATPLTGWLSDRIGKKALFLIAIAGFTLASALCGIATSLEEMVLFRILQGIFGAFIVPMAQSVMLDTTPREKFGQAMAIYGAGIMVGPIIGPTLGGWLTESFNWRWVFLVNLPVGILAFCVIFFFMYKDEIRIRRFDFFGFGMLAIAVGALQLLLDRGAEISWFEANESWIYLGLVIGCFWMFLVHCATAEDPFVDLRMFKDRNLSMGLLFIFVIGLAMFSALALLPPLLQNLLSYPVMTAGLVMAPRGIGTMISMIFVGRLVSRMDARILVLAGLAIAAYASYMMTGFDTTMGAMPFITSGIVQGIGLGLVFVPLSTLTFATIEPKFRTEATSFFSLVRNIGQGVGISIVTVVLTHMSSVNHAELAERVRATNLGVQHDLPSLLSGNALMTSIVNQLVTQQAAMLAYVDDFWLMMWITIAAMPIVLFLRPPPKDSGNAGHAAAAMD